MNRESRNTNAAKSPRLAIEVLSTAVLTCNPQNARLHPERHIRKLARSIEAFGYNCPLLVDANNQIIAGHGRFLAVRHLGWTEVPVIRLEHLTPDQVRAYALADNVLTDASNWDDRLLAEQLKYLAEAELTFDLDAIGFDLPEIDLMIQSLGDLDDEPEVEIVPPAGEPVVTSLGDVWHLGPHRIVCGSALEAASYDALLGSQRAAMVFVDPPYNCCVSSIGGKGQIQHAEFVMASGEMSREDFTAFLRQSLGLLKQYSEPGALHFVCMDWRGMSALTTAIDAQGLEQKNLCVWDKGVGGMGSLYRSQHELVFVLKSGNAPHINNVQLGRFGRNRTNLWAYPGANSFARKTDEGNLLELHPTVKPVALVADAILDASGRGDSVLDAFLGSGSTLIAAEKTGRIGLGIELDPKYVDVAVRRWQRLTGQHATHAVTGQTFEQHAQEHRPCVPPAVIPTASAEGAHA